eukprot:sb/3474379/
MEIRRQPNRRCKSASESLVQWGSDENGAVFSPRPFLKTEQIPIELETVKTEPQSDNETYSQVNPMCMKCELDVDCKMEPGVLKTEPVDPEQLAGYSEFNNNFEQSEFSVPCSSKSSSVVQNSKFIDLDLKITNLCCHL